MVKNPAITRLLIVLSAFFLVMDFKLPEMDWTELADTANAMLGDLMYQRLRVTLAPSQSDDVQRGRMIRVVEQQNPRWYRELCREYTARRSKPRRRRKHDMLLKRQHVMRALEEIADGRCQTEYAQRVLPFVEAQAEFYRSQCGGYGW